MPGGAAVVFRRKIWSKAQKTPSKQDPFKLDPGG